MRGLVQHTTTQSPWESAAFGSTVSSVLRPPTFSAGKLAGDFHCHVSELGLQLGQAYLKLPALKEGG